MKIHHLSAALLATRAAAFAPTSSTRQRTALNIATMPNVDVLSAENDRKGAMINLDGIAFSGLQGKALSLTTEDFPDRNAVSKVIPEDCYESDTLKSLGYLAVSVLGTAACTAVGVAATGVFNPNNIFSWIFWLPYDLITG